MDSRPSINGGTLKMAACRLVLGFAAAFFAGCLPGLTNGVPASKPDAGPTLAPPGDVWPISNEAIEVEKAWQIGPPNSAYLVAVANHPQKSEFLVAWPRGGYSPPPPTATENPEHQEVGIYGQRFNSSGEPLGRMFLWRSPATVQSMALAPQVDGDGYVAAWAAAKWSSPWILNPATWSLSAALIVPDGTIATSSVLNTTTELITDVKIASAGDHYACMWGTFDQYLSGFRLSMSLTPIGQSVDIAKGPTVAPRRIAIDPTTGLSLLSWENGALLVDSQARRVGPDEVVSSGDYVGLVPAFNSVSNEFLVGMGRQVYRISREGQRLEGPIPIWDGPANIKLIGFDERTEQYVVIWRQGQGPDLFLSRLDLKGRPVGSPVGFAARIRDANYALSHDQGSGRFLFAWGVGGDQALGGAVFRLRTDYP